MTYNYLTVSVVDKIGIVELNRPPHNFFDIELISGIADAWESFEVDRGIRAIVLCSKGKSFCAGADFSKQENISKKRSSRRINPLYQEAIRLFSCTKPVVAAIEGSAIGGGMGLALTSDFRVTCKEARFSANFNRLGFHPGFGLSHTLPALVGRQKAAWMFYTGARIDGEKAFEIGLVDFLVAKEQVREHAMAQAREIAISSPRAVQSTRETLRGRLLDEIRIAVARESAVQAAQMQSEDIKEGVSAMAEKRTPLFAD